MKSFSLVLLSLTLATPAAADCTGKTFSTAGDTGYFYVINSDSSATATFASMIGHFWQPGAYGTTGEQGCDESHWLQACAGCGGGPIGRTWALNGTFGQMGCVSGCPSGAMIVTLEDRRNAANGSTFLVARVSETAGFTAFDFSRIGRNLDFVPTPKPQVLASTSGEVFQLSFFIPDPAGGFYGLTGVPASSTITAFWLYSGSLSLSSPDRSSWTFVGRYPYTGGITQGQATLVCPPTGIGVNIAAAIEFDSGQVVTSYVSAPTFVECDPYAAGAGAVRDGGANGLFVRRESSGDLTLTWGPSCSSGDQGFEIYEGTLGSWASHAPRSCLAVSPSTFPPPPFDAYYLVVPFEDSFEGSYGTRSDRSERPLGTAVCRQRLVNLCPP